MLKPYGQFLLSLRLFCTSKIIVLSGQHDYPDVMGDQWSAASQRRFCVAGWFPQNYRLFQFSEPDINP